MHLKIKYLIAEYFPEFVKFTAEIFATRLAVANLITKTDFDSKPISLNKKINSNKTKHVFV